MPPRPPPSPSQFSVHAEATRINWAPANLPVHPYRIGIHHDPSPILDLNLTQDACLPQAAMFRPAPWPAVGTAIPETSPSILHSSLCVHPTTPPEFCPSTRWIMKARDCSPMQCLIPPHHLAILPGGKILPHPPPPPQWLRVTRPGLRWDRGEHANSIIHFIYRAISDSLVFKLWLPIPPPQLWVQ
jgi:hypothetical protein